MAKIISLVNQKGGVAKTTSTYNIACALVNKGQKVLMVDLDPQASLTIACGYEPYKITKNIYNAMMPKSSNDYCNIKDCIIEKSSGLYLIPSDITLASWEMMSLRKTKEEFVEAILAEINNGQYGKALLQLVNYRIQGHEMDIMMDVLEVVIRMGINEFAEAEICAYRGLEKEPHNYELYLNLAQIGYMTGAVGKLEKYAPLAIEYSKGTPDEEYVRNIIGELKS